jgi:hypothetical protein
MRPSIGRRPARAAAIAALGLVAVALCAPRLPAMEDLARILAERAREVPTAPQAYKETWLLPPADLDAPTADDAAIRAVVAVLQKDGRERIENRRLVEDAYAPRNTLLGADGTYWLRGPDGDSPFLETALREDPLLHLVLAGPIDVEGRMRTLTDDAGRLVAVVLREEVPMDLRDEDFLVHEGPVGADPDLLARLGTLDPLGRDRQPTPSAAPKGVEEIQTAQGSRSVTPDPAAVQWLESREVSALDFERFRRAVRLPPYDALPSTPATKEDS